MTLLKGSAGRGAEGCSTHLLGWFTLRARRKHQRNSWRPTSLIAKERRTMAREVVMAVSRAEKWGSAFSSWRGERVVTV